MLKTDVDRGTGWTQIPRYIRAQVKRSKCQICGRPYGKVYCLPGNKIVHPKECLHHILSRRFLAMHGIFEHHPTNLLSICSAPCHVRLLKVEDRLFQGDVIGFLTGNKQLGIDPQWIIKFAVSVGLKEFDGVRL
jgi:hypothetical protein